MIVTSWRREWSPMASELETRMTEHAALVRHFHEGVPGVECSHTPRKAPCCIVEADAILASDWLRERDRKVREETKAGIAEAIEAAYQEGRGWLSTIREEDADIARDWEK